MVDSANEQMQWLSSELKKAKEEKRKVIIQSHMPPGYVVLLYYLPFSTSCTRV